MKCPHCDAEGKFPVLATRDVKGTPHRRRGCAMCGKTFVTFETVSACNSIPGTNPCNYRPRAKAVPDLQKVWR